MGNRKLIAFILLSLIVTVSAVPATSGLELKKIGIKKTDSKRCINEKIIGKRPHLTAFLNRVEYNRFEIIEGKGYSIYEIDYAVKNTGTSFYLGKPLHEIIKPDSLWHVFSDWYNIFPLFLLKSREKSFSKEIKINSGENIEPGDERYFAGQIAQLSVGFRLDHPEDVESSYQYVKYWNDNINYEPTLAHLLVSTPWQYKTNSVEINNKNLTYLNLIINENLPDVIENQRLGWIKNLTIHLKKMIDDVKDIFVEYDEEFIIEAWPYIQPLVNWMITLGDYFVKMLHGVNDPYELEDIIDNFIDILYCKIPYLEDIADHYPDEKEYIIDNLVTDANNFYEWIDSEPWKKPIRIMGKIEGLKDNEILEISCKNITNIYNDEDDGKDDNIINYKFYLPIDPLNSKDSYFEPHSCTITINGSKHNKTIKSLKMLSYCFSDGILLKNFKEEDWKIDKKEKTDLSRYYKYPLVSKAFNIIENLPIIKSIRNQQTQSPEIVYKEYYPGAQTDDPHIVYYEPGEIIVSFTSFITVQYLTEFFDCEVIEVIPDINAALLDVSGRQEDIWTIILLLSDFLEVQFAELNIVSTVTSDLQGSCDNPGWAKEALNCEKAWKLTKGDSSIDIAIVDSGINSHADIKKPKSEIDFASHKVIWDYDAQDDVGHGTKVTGIIMATWNDIGIDGIAPKCSYHAVKVLSPSANEEDESGDTTMWDLAAGICYAARPTGLFGLLGLDAEVICCAVSYTDGTALKKLNILRGACRRARNVYHSVIIASAHNTNTETVGAPAAYDTTICVGSIDKNNKRCSFSPSSELIDVVAPGKNIYTTDINNGYDFEKGNSFSTAYVASIAALYLSYKGITSPMSKDDVENCEKALTSSAKNLEGEQYCGKGLVDALKAVKYKNDEKDKPLNKI